MKSRKYCKLLAFNILFSFLISCGGERNIAASKYVLEDGKYLLETGDSVNAYLKFTEAIKLNTDNKYAYYYRALMLKPHEDNYAQIIKDCESILNIDPLFDSAYILIIPPYAEKYGQEQAIKLLDKGISNNPNSAIIYLLRGILFGGKEEYAKSINDLEKSIQLNAYKDSYTHFILGKARFRNKEFKAGIREFDEALRIDNKETESYFWRGACKSKLGLAKEAIDDYTKCIELNIRKEQALRNRGVDYQQLLLHKNAIKDFTKCIELDNSLIDLFYLRAVSNYALANYNACITDCNLVIISDETNTASYLLRGKCYIGINRISKACSDLNSASKNGSSEAFQLVNKYCN